MDLTPLATLPRPVLPEPAFMAEALEGMGIGGEDAARVMCTLLLWRAAARARESNDGEP